MKNTIITVLAVFLVGALQGQVKGIVYGSDKKKKEAIYGAKVKLLKAKYGAITDEEGRFELILPKVQEVIAENE